MGVAAQIAFISGGASLFLIALYVVEARRGARFGDGVRAVFDRLILRVRALLRDYIPEINSLFFQELFFYLLHITFSRILAFVRTLERLMLRIVRFNRLQAQRLRERGEQVLSQGVKQERKQPVDSHLAELAEHKKSMELSSKEKARRKHESIENSGPIR